MERMQRVTSAEGVEIAFWTSGNGPHLVLVHGMSADHTRWPRVLPRLNEHFTVHAVDRRGRGGSGDAPGYSVEREFDDIAAVCDSLDGPVSLLGHSYGGLCALGAVQRCSNIEKLILYEPSIALDRPLYPPDVVARMEALLEQGSRDEMMATLFREIVEVSESELEALRADASWEARLANAHTIPRELAVDLPDASAFRDLSVPSLMITGETSVHSFPTRRSSDRKSVV